MIICIDLGNTSTVIGILDGTSVKTFWQIMTQERTTDEYGMIIQSLLARDRIDAESIRMSGLCSVVPSETDEMCRAVSSVFGVDVRTVDAHCDCGIRIVTDNPDEVGGDRVANAVGAFHDYGGPAIVVDMGTATTFDYISEKGEYRGGVIAPGMIAGASDLRKRARMLPAVEIRRPPKLIGTSTVKCMQAGIYYGSIGQVEGVVRRMWEETGSQGRVIMTGGQALMIWEEVGFEVTYDPHLTLKGVAYAVDPRLRHKAG